MPSAPAERGDLAFSILVLVPDWCCPCGLASCLKRVPAADTGGAQNSWSLWPGPAAPFVSELSLATGRPSALQPPPSEVQWSVVLHRTVRGCPLRCP